MLTVSSIVFECLHLNQVVLNSVGLIGLSNKKASASEAGILLSGAWLKKYSPQTLKIQSPETFIFTKKTGKLSEARSETGASNAHKHIARIIIH